MEVKAPKSLKKPMIVPHKLMMGPGPSNCTPRVLHGLSQPVLGHLHTETTKMMDEVKEGIQYIFQTRNELTLALSTSGHGGMEALLCNLLEDGERVLIAINGIWGERAADMARRYGADVHTIQTSPGTSFTHDQLETAIMKHKPVLLFIVQGESSTGVYQELEGLGDLCHRYNCLLGVDAVASLGGVPLFTDRWGIDAVYTGSQKVLGAPPGITPISFSPKAQQKIFGRKTPVKVYYFDMTVLGEYWACFDKDKPRFYHHTISATLLYGLREALAQACDEGIDKIIKRHEECAQLLYKGLKEMGLELYVPYKPDRLPTVTTIKVSESLAWKDVVTYCMNNHLLEIAGGLGPTVGKVFRIGIMGYNATPDRIEYTLQILKEALNYVKSTKKSKM